MGNGRCPVFGSYRVTIWAFMLAMSCACLGASLSLPPVFDSNDLLESCVDDSAQSDALQLEANVIACADNNVGPIWEITNAHQPSRVFTGTSGHALMQSSRWAEMSYRGWWITRGDGRRDSYAGNDDAAQLWIDSHSGTATRATYQPDASRVRVATAWYGVGRDIPFRAGDLSGTAGLQVRSISARDYLGMSVTGEVQSDGAFTGMMRMVTSDRRDGRSVRGDGWALDARLRLRYRDEWTGQLAAEGVLGRIAYPDLEVEDSLITSPRTFTDPDGFLHDIGGVTGASWDEDREFGINPYYRLDVIRLGNPYVMLGIGCQAGYRATPSLGIAWPQRKNRWLPFLRYYPAQQTFEVGAVGSGWQIRIAGDDWLFASPKSAEVSASLRAFRF